MEIFKQITANGITLKEYPFIKELAMEAYLLENGDILKLDKTNFDSVSVLDEEIALKKGRKNGDGRIDLLVKYSDEYLGIVELKLNEISEESLKQLESYLDQRSQILELDTNYWESNSEPKWIGVLVGSEISSNLRDKLLNGYTTKDNIPIAGMTIRRFRSPGNEIFVVTDTFFKFNYGSKDFSKFKFNGKSYNKGRLVNAVIKKVVEDNPKITFSELKQKFPDRVQGSMGVFDLKEKAEEIFERTNRIRYYIKPDEVIQLADNVLISTSTQWHPDNIKAFIEQEKKRGYKVEIE
jgi:hypothetical protein